MTASEAVRNIRTGISKLFDLRCDVKDLAGNLTKVPLSNYRAIIVKSKRSHLREKKTLRTTNKKWPLRKPAPRRVSRRPYQSEPNPNTNPNKKGRPRASERTTNRICVYGICIVPYIMASYWKTEQHAMEPCLTFIIYWPYFKCCFIIILGTR